MLHAGGAVSRRRTAPSSDRPVCAARSRPEPLALQIQYLEQFLFVQIASI